MAFTLRHLLLISCLIAQAQGGFLDPYLSETDSPPENVVITNPGTGGTGGMIRLPENILKEGDDPLHLVKVNVNGQSALSIQSSNPETTVFTVEQVNTEWHLVQGQPFDFEVNSTYFLVLAHDGSLATVIIQLEDVNDEPVEITGTDALTNPYNERETNATPITTVYATDKDAIDNNSLTFEFEHLIGDGGGPFFRMDSTTGELFVIKAFDYRNASMHRLQLWVYDSGKIHNDSITITIEVRDIPDEAPEFTRHPPSFTVYENTPVGERVEFVQARDGDIGIDWPIEYILTETHENPQTPRLFTINANTGDITVANEIDAEMLLLLENTLIFNVNITAREIPREGDFEAMETTVNISITIRDVNDNPPEVCIDNNPGPTIPCSALQLYTVSIPETHRSELPLNPSTFIVRDLDSTFAYSQNVVDFAEDTDARIKAALQIQPGSGSGTTAYSIVVRDVEQLNYESEPTFWWKDEVNPVPLAHTFDVIITSRENSTHSAIARITLEVTDVNDNDPIFSGLNGNSEYDFNVCEENPDGTALNVLDPPVDDPNTIVCIKWDNSGTPIQVVATDADISPQFKDIRYSWYSRSPPVAVDPNEGTMTINLDEGLRNFDREMYPTEFFTIQALDSLSNRATRVTVKFNVLDRNDEAVDLRLPQFQVTVPEAREPNPGHPVLPGIITVTSRDFAPDIDVEIKWEGSKLFRKSHLLQDVLQDPIDLIQKWFALEVDKSDPNNVTVVLVLGDTEINRELTEAGVDRVDLVIAARDNNVEPEWADASEVLQTLIIRIDDINDFPPEFEDVTNNQVSTQIQETEAFGPDGDESTDSQREIYTFRVRDRDLSSMFNFTIEPFDCERNCEEYAELVKLDPLINSTQKTTLYRAQDKLIDREETKFYMDGRPLDVLRYKVTVCDNDCTNSEFVVISINVEDRNDNYPKWENTHPTQTISELAPIGEPIATYLALDDDKIDKYGKIGYVLSEDNQDNAKFLIGDTTGILTVNGNFEWSDKSVYTVTIIALDNYRPGLSAGSQENTTTTIITIRDENTHAPEFMTIRDPLDNPYETWPQIDQRLNQTITVLDRDDPSQDGNGQYTVQITKISKDGVDFATPDFPFRTGTLEDGSQSGEKIVPIITLKNLTGEWGTYVLTFLAVDEATPSNSSEKSYRIVVQNENLNTPMFLYPAPTNETSVIISLDSGLGPVTFWDGGPVPYCNATDDDDPLTDNSQVWYEAVEHEEDDDDGFFYFRVNENGQIILQEPLDGGKSFHNVYIKAQDRGEIPRFSEARIRFYLRPNANRNPFFNDSTPLNISIVENAIGAEHVIRSAFDPDLIDFPDSDIGVDIYYYIVGGSTEYFRIEVREVEGQNTTNLITVEPLDREFISGHHIVVFVSNSPNLSPDPVDPGAVPDNPSYLLVNIEVENLFDTHPEFPQASEGGIISGGFSANNYQSESIAVISVNDLDDDDYVTFTLSETVLASDPSLADVTRPFLLADNTSTSIALQLNFTPQPSMKGHFTFNITGTDLGLLSTTVQVKVYMIKDTNVVTFKFLNNLDQVLNKTAALTSALSVAFEYRCNIDRISSDEFNAINTTVVLTHFIDLGTNEPILGSYIEQQQYNPVVYKRLQEQLTAAGIILDAIGKPQTLDDESELVVYLLIGGLGFLGVVLVVLSTSCYFKTRSLGRKVRALTATTFGSQMSGLNRTGATLDLPNTNEFAIQGSNPMWTTDPGDAKRTPAFDAESIGSGGSVLIGVEDDDDFKNYKGTEAAGGASAPFDHSDDDDDLYGDERGQNQAYGRDAPVSYDDYESGDAGTNTQEDDDQEDHAYDDPDDRHVDLGMPPPMGFGDSNMRQNPLMNLGAYEEGEDDLNY